MVFLSELKSHVDFRLLVAYHDDSSASTALITERGGRSAVGKALQPFRKLVAAFVQTNRAVTFATWILSRSTDWEMQIVRLLEDFARAEFCRSCLRASRGFGMVRSSGSLNSSFKKSQNSFWSMTKCPCGHYFRLKHGARHSHRPPLC